MTSESKSSYSPVSRSVSPVPDRPGSANSLKASTGSGDSSDVMCTTPIAERDGRRPFLQIVVLYANDSRVFNYAKEVQHQFIENGIDVYLQIGVENVPSKEGLKSSYTDHLEKDREIKTENLAEIITTSIADFLIVIGDRNMKNKSCQAKKKGRLVEMDVEDMINAIWSEWSPYQSVYMDVDANNMDTEKILAILEEHFNLRHLNNRLKRIKDMLTELKSMNVKPRKSSELLHPEDSRFAEISTNLQKMLIKLHQQLKEVEFELMELNSADTPIVDQSQYGLKVGPDYRPSTKSFINRAIREKLLSYLRSLINKVEEKGSVLLEYGAPLWSDHLNQYKKDEHENSISSNEKASEFEIKENPSYLRRSGNIGYNDNDEWEHVGLNKSRRRQIQEQRVEEQNVQFHNSYQVVHKQESRQESPLQSRREGIQYPMESHSPVPTHQNGNESRFPNQYMQLRGRNYLRPNQEGFNVEGENMYISEQNIPHIKKFESLYPLINSLWAENGYSNPNPDDTPPNEFDGWVKAFKAVPDYIQNPQQNIFDYLLYNSKERNQQENVDSNTSSNINLDFDDLPDFPPESNSKRPCLYCGKESTLECNICAKNNQEAYFCCPEHQKIMWKKHVHISHRSLNYTFPSSPSHGGMINLKESAEIPNMNNVYTPINKSIW